MPPTLYYAAGCGPSRTVLLAARALSIELHLRMVDLANGQHMTPEFMDLNLLHSVPTLVDEGFSICESRAIITYLANKYAKGSPLHPEEPKARALVDQWLFFDLGTLYVRFADYFLTQIHYGQPADPEKKAKLEETLLLLDIMLEGQEYCAGDHLTLADISLVVDVSDLEATDMDFLKYNNIRRWYETVKKTAPGYEEINGKGLQNYKDYVKIRKGRII